MRLAAILYLLAITSLVKCQSNSIPDLLKGTSSKPGHYLMEADNWMGGSDQQLVMNASGLSSMVDVTD